MEKVDGDNHCAGQIGVRQWTKKNPQKADMAKPLRTFFKGSLFTFWIKKKRRRSKSRKRQIYLRAGGGVGQG